MANQIEQPDAAHWRVGHLLAALFMVAAAVAAMSPAWARIVAFGLQPEHSHILLAPVVAGWIVLANRGNLATVRRRHRWVGPFVVLLGWVLYSLGYQQTVVTVWWTGALVAAVGAIVAVTGVPFVGRFAPAFLALALVVPPPGQIRGPLTRNLMLVTAQATEILYSSFAVDIQRTGNLLMVNGHEVAVVEACNGARMVFSLGLVVWGFAFTRPMRPLERALILLATPLLALVANVGRLIPTVWLFGHAEPATAERFHDLSGWLILLLAFGLLVGLLKAVRWALAPTRGRAGPKRDAQAPGAAAGAPA